MRTTPNGLTTGERLRSVREAQGLSIPALAERAAMHESTVWRYETGRRSPAATAIAKICVALQCTPNDVIPGPWNRSADGEAAA
jgi:transcriptional regulator with XRE-family HTH domain